MEQERSLKAGLVTDAPPDRGRRSNSRSAGGSRGAGGSRSGAGGGGGDGAAAAKRAAAPAPSRALVVDASSVEHGSIAYASLSVEEEDPDSKLPPWHLRWMGRILVLRLPCRVVYIGPHWYGSVVMLCFILGVGYFFTNATREPLQKVSGVVATALSTVTFLRCALSHPGVLEKGSPAAVAAEALATEAGGGGEAAAEDPRGRPRPRPRRPLGGRRCNRCEVYQPPGCTHCEFCDVCIERFDHHCLWMGKCIGRRNLCAFYAFLATSMASLSYILVVTVFYSSPPPPTATPAPFVMPHRSVPT